MSDDKKTSSNCFFRLVFYIAAQVRMKLQIKTPFVDNHYNASFVDNKAVGKRRHSLSMSKMVTS